MLWMGSNRHTICFVSIRSSSRTALPQFFHSVASLFSLSSLVVLQERILSPSPPFLTLTSHSLFCPQREACTIICSLISPCSLVDQSSQRACGIERVRLHYRGPAKYHVRWYGHCIRWARIRDHSLPLSSIARDMQYDFQFCGEITSKLSHFCTLSFSFIMLHLSIYRSPVSKWS